MSEGVTLLTLGNLMVSGGFTILWLKNRKSYLIQLWNPRRIALLTACGFLFAGSFFISIFYLYTEKLMDAAFVSMGWQACLLLWILVNLGFGAGRFWRLLRKHIQAKRSENALNEPQSSEAGKEKPGKDAPRGHFGFSLLYGMILTALVLMVLLVTELLLCSFLSHLKVGKPLLFPGIYIAWKAVSDQLMGVLSVCSAFGCILTAAAVGKEYELYGKRGRRDKMDEVKRYLWE